MPKCKYKFNTETGKYMSEIALDIYLRKTFQNDFTDENLNTYLKRKDKESIKALKNSVVFSLDTNKSADNTALAFKALASSARNQPKGSLISVEELITTPLDINSNKRLVPEYIEEERLKHEPVLNIKAGMVVLNKEDISNGVTLLEKATQEVKNTIEHEKILPLFGNSIHRLLNIVLTDKLGLKSPKYRAEIERLKDEEFKEMLLFNTTSEVNIEKIVNTTILDLYNHFYNSYISQGGKVLSEMSVFYDQPKLLGKNGVGGRIDIIAIDADGLAHIYDLKLSTKPYDQ